jgi:hypothetical protein
MPAGRPTKYKPEYVEQVYKLCLLNAIDSDMADFFGVSESTFYKWKEDHEEFSEAIKKGKDFADANVANRLYNRAMGYEHSEDKIFNNNGEPMIVPTTKHYPPDTTAAIFWLKNRQPQVWRDRVTHDGTMNLKHEGNVTLNMVAKSKDD